MAANILPQKVRLTRAASAETSGFIIPAGKIGRVIEYNPTTNKLMVDFGLSGFAQAVDPDSDIIEAVYVA